jgi:NifB/MoaA-like Fe-S oxidoreductase
MAVRMEEKYPNITVNVYKIINQFFGPSITVSGLLTGQDLIQQLKDKELGDKLLLPCNILRSGEDVFLDDITLSELESTLQVKIDIVKSSGRDFVDSVIFAKA